MRPKIECSLYW